MQVVNSIWIIHKKASLDSPTGLLLDYSDFVLWQLTALSGTPQLNSRIHPQGIRWHKNTRSMH